ncbi:MAG TPA: methyl-accepting chemotaxis protein, partial [Marinobacter hydrocarbonoclasticus]|nr:methyl-accepting chemotaxis protein [Marinobacter nauticus]
LSRLRQQLTSANDEMDRLTERSNAISMVLEVISDIAEQTNLL